MGRKGDPVMAHLWVRNENAEWAVVPLDADAFDLSVSPPRATPLEHVSKGGDSRVFLLRLREAREWILLSSSQDRVRVNGLKVASGIRVLSDRDEIRVEGVDTFFFSTERLAVIEPFPGAERAVFCPRCKQGFQEGALAVQCPQCKVWHHQSEELPCWTYSPTCALDDQPTDLDADYRWTPREL
jgi:hypothetical protein